MVIKYSFNFPPPPHPPIPLAPGTVSPHKKLLTVNSLGPDFMQHISDQVIWDRCKLNLSIPKQTKSRLALIVLSLMVLRFGTLYLLISRQLKTLNLLKL